MLQPHGIFGRFLLGPLWNRHNARLNDRTLQALQLEAQDRVLDIGFGGGYLLEKMLGIVTQGQIAGLDSSIAMVTGAQKKFHHAILQGRIEILWGCVEEIPFEDGTFNKISSVNSIFYWNDPGRGFAEIYRVLKKNGDCILTFTVEKDLQKRGFAPHGIRSYSETDVASALSEAGFNKVAACIEQDKHRSFLIFTAVK